MKRAGTVFASKTERRAFKIIEAGLPVGWSLYPNLPLSQIVQLKKDEVSEEEWDFYLKSSVDLALTTPTDELFLAIEFDGLAGGFSAGSVYKPVGPHPDPSRERKLSFKLALCREVELPLFVISFDEIEALPGEDAIRIIHGLVAQCIVRREMQSKIRHWDRNDRSIGKTIDDMLWDSVNAEASLQHKYDPFRKGLEALWAQFSRLKVRWSLEPVSRPELLAALDMNRPLESVGCRFTGRGEDLQVPVIFTVWVRNFAGEALGHVLDSDLPVAGGVNPLRVAENAAWYLGVKKVVELNT